MLLRLRLDLVLAAFVQHEGGKVPSLFYLLLITLRSKPGILLLIKYVGRVGLTRLGLKPSSCE